MDQNTAVTVQASKGRFSAWEPKPWSNEKNKTFRGLHRREYPHVKKNESPQNDEIVKMTQKAESSAVRAEKVVNAPVQTQSDGDRDRKNFLQKVAN